MEKLNFNECKIRGELSYRIIKNYARLEAKEYRAEQIFNMDQNGWPGDWEGRTILALVLLGQATGREPAFLSDILTQLKQSLNEKGYLGEALSGGFINEQQLSGHNWLLRGLLEFYQWKKDPQTKRMIRNIFENLYLPLLEPDAYQRYPLEPSSHSFDGAADGHLQESVVDGWKLSTDIGCAFMSIDGLSQYYQIFKDQRALLLLQNMIDWFCCIDFCRTSMQTHASLTATRGIIRLYETTRMPKLLEFAISLFELYQQHGMTENYANYNWFDRPTWTEPCGIVDAYLLAMELFRFTNNTVYLTIANKTFFSALLHAQRENGGFGCDNCLTETKRELTAYSAEYYEAYWCCTMRGGEGLTQAVRYSVLHKDDRFVFTGLVSADYSFAQAAFQVDSRFPQKGEINILVTRCQTPIQLCFFLPPEMTDNITVQKDGMTIPPYYQNEFCCIHADTPCKLILTFDIPLRSLPSEKNDSAITLWRGYTMYGLRQHDFPVSVDDSIYRSRQELLCSPTKLIFTREEIQRMTEGNTDEGKISVY